jgi:hypothetical protein
MPLLASGVKVIMNLSDPAVFISGVLIGLIGMALFMYGKKAIEPKCIGIGLAMCVYPYFISSVLIMWVLAGACLAGVYLLPRSS